MKKRDLMSVHNVVCKLDYKPILKKYSNKATNLLINNSPHSDRPNRKTPYRYGWIAEERQYRSGDRITIWNKTNWQLTHLLENGHFITNHESGLAWSPPIKHIKPTFDKVSPQFVKAMQKVDIDFKIT